MELSSYVRCQLGALFTIILIAAIAAQPTGGEGWSIGDIFGRGAQRGSPWGQYPAWLYRDPAASSSGSHGGQSAEPGSSASQDSRLQGAGLESPRQPPGLESPRQPQTWAGPSPAATGQRPTILHEQGTAPIHPAEPIVTSESETAPAKPAVASASSQTPFGFTRRPSGKPRAPLVYAWFGEETGRSLIDNGLYRIYRASSIFNDDVGEWEKWLAHMRRATGRPFLRIAPIDVWDWAKDQVFVAQDQDPVDHPPLPESEHGSRWSGRLLMTKDPPGRTEHNLEKVKARDRVYVYLNSRSNMEYINREYFLGHARPLPILKEGLTRNSLNKMYASRNTHVLFPPRTQHGLPLVVLRHTGLEYTLQHIHSITGLEKKMHLMSLWSPVLFDGQRYTTMLYGIVGFDSRYAAEVLTHLDDMTKARDPDTYASVYALEDLVHKLQ